MATEFKSVGVPVFQAASASLMLAFFLSSCATQPAKQETAKNSDALGGTFYPTRQTELKIDPPVFKAPASLHWFRVSAERKALFAQSYRLALNKLPANPSSEQPWAVAIDADETILDNSTYNERLAKAAPPNDVWNQASWNVWARQKSATAFPEAVEFLKQVRLKGGKIAIITNRSETTCEVTRLNLDKEKVPYDTVLCAKLKTPGGDPDGDVNTNKEPRFEDVRSGRAFGTSAPHRIVLYIGDNIKDCSGQTQSTFDPDKFGGDCIVLPNPMYGSWEAVKYVPAE